MNADKNSQHYAEAEFYIRNVSVRRYSFSQKGYLTYRLFHNQQIKRSLILVSTNSSHNDLIPNHLLESWENFQNSFKNQGGNFYKAKAFVIDLKKNPNIYPNYGVAIHRFGPVPVFMT